MTELDFLEVNSDFRSYYKTLRDVNYYLSNSEMDKQKIEAATMAMSKLIYGFIRTNGTTFRDMDTEIYAKEYHMFQEDFLRIIENSGENNVDFDEFAGLLDELIGIANHRTTALQKIKTTRQETELSNEEGDDPENEAEVENVHVEEVQVVSEENQQVEEEQEQEEEQEEEDVEDDVKEDVEEEEDVDADEDDNDNVLGETIEIENETISLNSELLQDNDEDAENRNEIYESDDVFHYRPKRRRYR